MLNQSPNLIFKEIHYGTQITEEPYAILMVRTYRHLLVTADSCNHGIITGVLTFQFQHNFASHDDGDPVRNEKTMGS